MISSLNSYCQILEKRKPEEKFLKIGQLYFDLEMLKPAFEYLKKGERYITEPKTQTELDEYKSILGMLIQIGA